MRLEIDKYLNYLVDENLDKINTFSPGYHIPVYSPSKIDEDNPDLILIMAWRYLDQIREKINVNKTLVIAPLPHFQILD